jgi:hypothetical protein
MDLVDRQKVRKEMGKNELMTVKNKPSIVSLFCEKIGFLSFDFAKFFNSFSKKCLLKSGVKERIENALKEYEQKEDIGKKVMDYDRGIADVISKPVETLKTLESELMDTQKEKIDAQEYAKQCYEVMSSMYQAWSEKDDKRLCELFESFGFKEQQKR